MHGRNRYLAAMLIVLFIAAAMHLAVLAMLAWQWTMDNEQLTIDNQQLSIGHCPLSIVNCQLSIVVAARDEAENLKRFLPSVLGQVFEGAYEVIVALDRCTDGSAQVIADMQAQHPRLRVLHIDALPEGWTGKKHALHLAIQAARYDCLAFTDADCELPPRWLEGMAAQFAAGNDLVLGVSPYVAAPGLLNLLIRYETWITAILYVGLARLKMPYMAVGRSLGYRKAWFQKVGGFLPIADRLSGDDDLLVNRATSSDKIGFLLGVDYQVLSLPQTRWGSWRRQKIRHGSAGTAYKPSSLLILSAIHGLHLIFYLSLIVVLCLQLTNPWAWAAYLLRCSAMIGLLSALPWRDKAKLLLTCPLLDMLYLGYIVLLLPAAAFIQPKWKNTHGGSV